VNRMTYLLIEDIEDAPNPPRNLEGEQAENFMVGFSEEQKAAFKIREERDGRDDN
jgi:hypothetical protein